jgi:hypothetical protein
MPPMTPLLLGFVSHHQQVALILTGVMFASRFTRRFERSGTFSPRKHNAGPIRALSDLAKTGHNGMSRWRRDGSRRSPLLSIQPPTAYQKRPAWGPGVLENAHKEGLLRARGRLGRGNDGLCSRAKEAEGRETVLGQLGVEFTRLGRMRDKALVGALEIVALELDGLVQRLDAGQLLERRRILVKGLLGVVGGLDNDRLGAGGGDIEGLYSGVKTVFAECLNGLELLLHQESPKGEGAWRPSQSEPCHTPAPPLLCIAQ